MRMAHIVGAVLAAGILNWASPISAQQASAPPQPATAAGVIAPSPDAKVIVVGSVVQLRSGGPKMTVIELTPQIATVLWYLENSGFKQEKIIVAALKLAEDDSDDDDEDDESEDE